MTTNRCTSGVFLAIEGPNSSYACGAISKKQPHTATSTAEAEEGSGCYGLRQVGIPGLIIWDVIQGHSRPAQEVDEDVHRGLSGRILTPNEQVLTRRLPEVDKDTANKMDHVLYWHGDNTAEVAISHSGINNSIRHMSRTNGVNVSFIRDCIQGGLVKHPVIGTKFMCADIFTKFFSAKKSKEEWKRVVQNVNIFDAKIDKDKTFSPGTWNAFMECVGQPGPGHASVAAGSCDVQKKS